jgi:DNA-binding NarL/FixJ family response regulator
MAQGDYAEARTVLLQSVALHRQGGDQLGVARALRELCMTAYAEHDLLASQRYGEEGVAIFRALGSTMDLAVTLDDLAATYVAQGQYAAARTLYDEEFGLSISMGEPSLSALALVGLGMIAAQLADDGTAVAHLERAQLIQRELGEKWVLAATLHLLGEVVQRRGEWERAAGLYRESLLLAQAVGDKANMAQVLHQIGTLAHAQRQDQPAARLFAAAAAQRTASGGATFYTLANAADRADAIAAVRARLGEESFAACWAQGQAMPLEQVVALALQAADVAPPAPASLREDSPPATLLPAGFAHLTRREIEVLRLLAQGLTYAQIADKLVVSHRTVNAHVTSIYAKLGVTSRADATRLAAEHRLI